MSEDLIRSVKDLINLGQGDPGRLQYILDMLTNDRILPLSDQKYLEEMIPSTVVPIHKDLINKNETITETLQSELRDIKARLVKLEKRGFERYVGKKAVFFFVTVFVGWNALQSLVTGFLSQFLQSDSFQNFFPLNFVANFVSYPLISFIFTAMIYAWVFIGFIHLIRYIRSRKLPDKKP